MHLQRILKKSGMFFLSLCLLCLNLAPAQAAMVGTQTLIQQETGRIERAQLNGLLNRSDVKAQLVELGINPIAAQQRIDSLTNAEIDQLNNRLAELPAGEGILGLVVLIFVVFVITDALGATDLFPFVHPINR